jgi:hypothetical protein
LRRICHAKLVIDSVSRHPHDSVGLVDDQWDAVPAISWYFLIDKIVLKLLPPADAERPETVARPSVPDRKWGPATVEL